VKIDIDINDQYPETSVTIHAPRLSQDIEKLIAMMRMLDMQVSAEKNGETYILDANKILYIEAVERKTFIYTETEMYESELKLYEVEEQLLERDFLRVSKQTIVNLRMIKSLKADINRKIRLTLQNGEQIMVSRMYSDELRQKLGVR
jgi:DNA-binding LytR/AlgR family response regulator